MTGDLCRCEYKRTQSAAGTSGTLCGDCPGLPIACEVARCPCPVPDCGADLPAPCRSLSTIRQPLCGIHHIITWSHTQASNIPGAHTSCGRITFPANLAFCRSSNRAIAMPAFGEAAASEQVQKADNNHAWRCMTAESTCASPAAMVPASSGVAVLRYPDGGNLVTAEAQAQCYTRAHVQGGQQNLTSTRLIVSTSSTSASIQASAVCSQLCASKFEDVRADAVQAGDLTHAHYRYPASKPCFGLTSGLTARTAGPPCWEPSPPARTKPQLCRQPEGALR